MSSNWKGWMAGVFGAVCAIGGAPGHAAIWSDTEVQLLYGDRFQEPFNPQDVSKTILTFQHASGWEYGRNFFFVDMLRSDGADNAAGEVYGEWYSTFSFGKMFGTALKYGIVKDVGFTAGINYGAKSAPGPTAQPLIYLPGITVDFDLPGFAFFNVDVLAYIDRGKFGGVDNGCNADTYQVTPSWKLPFTLGPTKWSFEGFADFMGAHGNCAFSTLTQPQLRLDVGNFWAQPEKLFVGIEYQYWHNKYGVKDLEDNFPQLLGVWKF